MRLCSYITIQFLPLLSMYAAWMGCCHCHTICCGIQTPWKHLQMRILEDGWLSAIIVAPSFLIKRICNVSILLIWFSAPGQPVVTVTRIDSTSVRVSWTLVNGHDSIEYFLVRYYKLEDGSNRHTKNTTETSITINGLDPDAEYRFVVSFLSFLLSPSLPLSLLPSLPFFLPFSRPASLPSFRYFLPDGMAVRGKLLNRDNISNSEKTIRLGRKLVLINWLFCDPFNLVLGRCQEQHGVWSMEWRS